jgi:hypothetical protein
VFDRPGSDRWKLGIDHFSDAGPMVRIRFPPAASHQRTQGKVTQRYPRGSGISDIGRRGRVPPRVIKAPGEGFTLFVLQELNREDDGIIGRPRPRANGIGRFGSQRPSDRRSQSDSRRQSRDGFPCTAA